MNGDYHVHTAYCPHGSDDQLSQYIEQAISKGLAELSFTEHAPLPKNFVDPSPEKDSSMKWEDLEAYIQSVQTAKQQYQSDIQINLGFELDYIEGFERETTDFLAQYGKYMDDGILSVHMLKKETNHYVCLDYSRDEFQRIIQLFGDVETVYQKYYQTVASAIAADLGPYKPKRLGHLTLIHKFQHAFPVNMQEQAVITSLLDTIKLAGLSLDLNTAGLYKDDCMEIYPAPAIVEQAIQKGIPLQPGSDSHQASTIARGFEQLYPWLR
ncbi:histidinol-phosphatase HisJ [Gracilibacillus timonensis]|uniref:histidinol-phosphatase HisJ n=1 Tax=Gracilibacillus timonensis TaxID=1816696 RepID=UPI000826B407|nr:histidinol-phosphatase HisJ [Gracilibacillus timonensis]